MLDLQELQEQFAEFHTYQAREQSRLDGQLERACAALADCEGKMGRLREQVEAANPPWLVAGLREAPEQVHTCRDRPTPVTVVATDGSQIFPDRNVEPTCYLLNISCIAFQYGTTEAPVMDAQPHFHYRHDELSELFDEVEAAPSSEVVSALRDEEELRQLLDGAREARREGRPIVAMADGTLIRWMLRGMRNRQVEEELIRRYTQLLAEFRDERIPLCSYISMPANTEVVNLLRVKLGECETPEPNETLAGLVDRRVYGEVLAPGERSAVFESASHIQREYGPDRICYFYVCVPGRHGTSEVGRVEVPVWVADDERLLERMHAVVLSECRKGDGYPIILSEAHERAVIRAPEREAFYQLIERRMRLGGLRFTSSRKRTSKRRPTV